MIDAIEPYVVPQSKRYTNEDRAGAYLFWRTVGGRSIRKTSIRFGVDYNTIQNWRDKGDWIARANEEDHDDYASSTHGVAALVINELVANIETARDIRDDRTVSARDRLAAAQWLSGLAGVSPVSKIETAATDKRQTTIEVQPDFDNMSIQELRTYELSVRKRSRGFEPTTPVVNGSRPSRP